MTKLTKESLKDIVKECLIEILAEGLTSKRTASLNERKELKKQINNSRIDENRELRPARNRYSYLDNIPVGQRSSTNEEKERATKVAKTITSDPLMGSIFADTAMTTLKEQGISNRAKGTVTPNSDAAARLVESSDPAELFGEASQNWAHLAFSGVTSKS